MHGRFDGGKRARWGLWLFAQASFRKLTFNTPELAPDC